MKRIPITYVGGCVRLINVVGARPNFMKIAPLMAAYERHSVIDPILVHTGQHYDQVMSKLFFDELGLPKPHVNLGIGGGTHSEQTAHIMMAFEKYCRETEPDRVLVVGDVNSTIACALVASKLGIPLAHVEAGLRSFDRSMPEEINRVLTDALSDLLFVSEPSGVENLKQEGVQEERIHLVGNVMIDTLLFNRQRSDASDILQKLALEPSDYVLLTLHRPSNVDEPKVLEGIVGAVLEIASQLRVVFPAHPRTVRQLEQFGLASRLQESSAIQLTEPLGYLDFLKLMAQARVVLTDSGGIQEETTILKIPCLTLRHNTERPVTVEMGGNRIVGTDPETILSAFSEVLAKKRITIRTPPLWDGQAAERITEILVRSG
jgi:UDP-N-acetylglucosamine 2-epimerase (non-hydrolysing)